METNKNIVKAIIAVMKEVTGIEKSMTIGTGNASYKGVSDQDVKETIGSAMERNGLAILPINIKPRTTITSWEEVYNGNKKQRQSYFTEVSTKYLLIHESGESIEVAGYGHGVDSQDKSAGKATTYALKYALLYMFMVPTGKIDDADATHSDAIATPPPAPVDTRITLTDKGFEKLLTRIKGTEATGDNPAIPPEKSAYENALKTIRFTDDQRADLELTYQTAFPNDPPRP